MEIVTKKRICDRCGKEIEFFITNNIFAGDVIRIQRRKGITNHGEDWRTVDLCKNCGKDAEDFWKISKEEEVKNVQTPGLS